MEFSNVDVVADVGNRRFSSHLQNGTEFVDVGVVVFSVVVIDGCCSSCRTGCLIQILEIILMSSRHQTWDGKSTVFVTITRWKIEAFPSHFQKWNGILGCRHPQIPFHFQSLTEKRRIYLSRLMIGEI